MEVLGILIALVVGVAIICGIFMAAAPFIGWGIAVLTEFWPFALGCLIGVPLSMKPETKALGNFIVAAGVIGNVLWIAVRHRK